MAVRRIGNAYKDNSLEPWGQLPQGELVFPAKTIRLSFAITSTILTNKPSKSWQQKNFAVNKLF